MDYSCVPTKDFCKGIREFIFYHEKVFMKRKMLGEAGIYIYLQKYK
jgi:hypothetical protein